MGEDERLGLCGFTTTVHTEPLGLKRDQRRESIERFWRVRDEILPYSNTHDPP